MTTEDGCELSTEYQNAVDLLLMKIILQIEAFLPLGVSSILNTLCPSLLHPVTTDTTLGIITLHLITVI